jgi:selenocysteine lyase/cysteine desulfurase
VAEYPVDRIREDYRALHETCYLNTGTVGVMSESVLSAHLDRISHYERFGHYGESDARSGYERARESIANLINADAGEIALTRNASDGINYVLSGIQLPARSTLITTDQEHPAVILPLTLASESIDGSIAVLDLSLPNDDLLAEIERLLRERELSLAVISHVSCETGRRLPIERICALCRQHGARTLVDGAQSVGQFDVNVSEIGCDFMAGNAHKWLCGPKGTGFLYINRDRIDELTPPYAGDGAVEPKFDRSRFSGGKSSRDWTFRHDAQRFEFGTRNWHLFGAVADSIAQFDALGWTAVQKHVDKISSELKHELSQRKTVTVHTPLAWEHSCGIVTFTAEGHEGTKLSESLWNEHGIVQRRVQSPSGVRISCAHYTNRADIDRFLTALDRTLNARTTA